MNNSNDDDIVKHMSSSWAWALSISNLLWFVALVSTVAHLAGN